MDRKNSCKEDAHGLLIHSSPSLMKIRSRMEPLLDGSVRHMAIRRRKATAENGRAQI